MIRSAASSVALNLAEGRRRQGKDRQYHWSVAAGSADEKRTALRVARALGDLGEEETAAADDRLDQVLAICWGLTRP